jgi:hypothetical protein
MQGHTCARSDSLFKMLMLWVHHGVLSFFLIFLNDIVILFIVITKFFVIFLSPGQVPHSNHPGPAN